ncbi:MAG: pyruvate kinase [Actinobacteria bacterium]|nr:pyruvate kinase [Actinomycetota bacterium]
MGKRFTKIVATLGPATPSAEAIEQVLAAGVDVARLNMSHGLQEEHALRIAAVRRAETRLSRPIAILQDLAGPKIRLGTFAPGGVSLVTGTEVTLVSDDGTPGSASRIPVSLFNLSRYLEPETRVLIDDGRLRLQVTAMVPEGALCVVEEGGVVTDRKGINLPDVSLDLPPLGAKDLDDLAFGVRHGVDFVGLSFVRSAGDIDLLRYHLAQLGGAARIVAKIEKHEALDHIDDIIAQADAVMVARGDLGVEIPPELVPSRQKEIIRKTVAAGKEVITATQMLESMVSNPVPTRAEASDVANAVWDGTSAVMLSGETASGSYPVQSVTTMNRIVEAAEKDRPEGLAAWKGQNLPVREGGTGSPAAVSQAIARAACELAAGLEAAAIVSPTQTGATARQVARYRPWIHVLAATPSRDVWRHLALTYGVTPAFVHQAEDTDGTIGLAVEAAMAQGVAVSGDVLVVTCGARVNSPGTTNLIKVERA